MGVGQYGCGCQSRFGIPFLVGIGEFITHFRTYFSGFTGGTGFVPVTIFPFKAPSSTMGNLFPM